MKKLEVKDLKENFFEAIGKEWMLVTAGSERNEYELPQVGFRLFS